MKKTYIDHFIKLSSSPMFLQDDLYPNAKEITETMAGYYAVAQNLSNYRDGPDSFRNPDIQCLVVGDGAKPRTAAMMACMSKWNCFSIDPALRPKQFRYDRLKVISKKIEDSQEDLRSIEGKPCVLMQIHSHARLGECIKVLRSLKVSRISIVSMPCCVPQYIEGVPHHIEYRDTACWSPHNLIKIWKNIYADPEKEK